MTEGKKASVRYFTGTGNSFLVARACAAIFEKAGWKADIEPIAEAGAPRGSAPLEDADAACFAFPVYSLDLPRIVRSYLEKLPPRLPAAGGAAATPALVIATGGSPDDCGWSLIGAAGILRGKGYDPAYTDLIQMPNNWGAFMPVPGAEEGKALASAGEERARVAARAFLSGERREHELNLALFGPIVSRLLRSGFKLGVKRMWRFYSSTDACTGCGLCTRSCPVGAIEMAVGKRGGKPRPRWSAGCEQCMRCFNLCPTRAIVQLESIGHGSKRDRWIAPEFKPGN